MRHRRHVPAAEVLVEDGGFTEHILHEERHSCVSVGRGLSSLHREMWHAGTPRCDREARRDAGGCGCVRTAIFVTEDTSQLEMSGLQPAKIGS